MATTATPTNATCGAVRAAARVAATVLVTAGLLSGQALAQAKGKAPAKQAAAAPAQHQSPWVKLCEKAKVRVKDKAGKDGTQEKTLCLTTHEQLDANSGMPVISAAIREAEGSDKHVLAIMVPLGMVIPAGMRAAIVDKATWDKALAGQQIDDKSLKIATLNFAYCYAAGCTAEVQATKEIIDDMKKGAGMLVRAVDILGRPASWGVPLSGFSAAYAGPPTDNKKYAEARRDFMRTIEKQYEMQRQQQLAKDPKLAEAYKKMQDAQRELATVAQEKAAEAQKAGGQKAPAKK
jgi:invasion protein IalB